MMATYRIYQDLSGGSLEYGLQKQVSVMSSNLSSKLDELQARGDRQLETSVALCEIRTQLQELTKSVESCQSEVSEVKRDMVAIKHELDTVQQVKEEIEELREFVDRLGEQSHRRKLRLLEQLPCISLHVLAYLLECFNVAAEACHMGTKLWMSYHCKM